MRFILYNHKGGKSMTKLEINSEKIKEIKSKLLTDDDFLEKSVINLYHCQTSREQELGFTVSRNGKGFNMTDSFRLSKIAIRLIKGSHLSDKELKAVRKRMVKYARQLILIKFRKAFWLKTTEVK